MATSIYIYPIASNPGVVVELGVNGAISRLPVGLDVVVGDDVLDALNHSQIIYRLSSASDIADGYTYIDFTGSIAPVLINGVRYNLPIDMAFMPPADQLALLSAKDWYSRSVVIGGPVAPPGYSILTGYDGQTLTGYDGQVLYGPN